MGLLAGCVRGSARARRGARAPRLRCAISRHRHGSSFRTFAIERKDLAAPFRSSRGKHHEGGDLPVRAHPEHGDQLAIEARASRAQSIL